MSVVPGCPWPRKQLFVSRAEAKRAARRGRKFLRAYRCPCGGHWHLTSRRHAR